MKYTKIEFTIKCTKEEKEAEIEFALEYNENGECTDGESFNPTSGPTNYTNWHNGWIEHDPEIEELYQVIREYSTSMSCEERVAEFEITDINYERSVDDYEEYNVSIICTDIGTYTI